MEGRLLAAQIVRVPVLLLLLRVTARPLEMHREAQGGLAMERIWGPWIMILVITLAFVVIVMLGRRRWHPWALLGVEAAVAAVLAVVPPAQWVLWFGIEPWLNAMVGGVVQPLAMAWLGVVAVSAFHQRREARASASSEAG